MNKKELQNIISYETDEEMLLMDGFEDAFIGFSRRCGQPTLATYSFLKMLQVLVDRDDMSFEEAEEYIMFNCEGAWMGALTPIILHEYIDPFVENWSSHG
tara:strand:+ start:299 stop:598 length:300 start_codon:yes stop_codon:yes gene_type:complete